MTKVSLIGGSLHWPAAKLLQYLTSFQKDHHYSVLMLSRSLYQQYEGIFDCRFPAQVAVWQPSHRMAHQFATASLHQSMIEDADHVLVLRDSDSLYGGRIEEHCLRCHKPYTLLDLAQDRQPIQRDTTTPNFYCGEQLPPTSQICAYEGDYARFTLTDRREGLIDREGNIVFMPEEPSFLQHRCGHIWDVTPYADQSEQTYQIDASDGGHRTPYYLLPQPDGRLMVMDLDTRRWRLVTPRPDGEIVIPRTGAGYLYICRRGRVYLGKRKDNGPWTIIAGSMGGARIEAISRLTTGSPLLADAGTLGGLMQWHTEEGFPREMWCSMRPDGTLLHGPEYDYMEGFAACGLAIAATDERVSLIDTDGHEVLSLAADRFGTTVPLTREMPLTWCAPDLLAFRRNGLWGVMDTTGQVLIEPTLRRIDCRSESNRLHVQTTDGRWVYMDRQGRELFPQLGATFMMYRSALGVYSVHDADERWGILREDGEWLLPMECDHLSYHSLSEVSVTRDGRHFVLSL